MRNFFFFLGLELMQSFIVTWNWRSIAATNYPHITISEFVWAVTNFLIIKKVAATPHCKWAVAGYTTGALIGVNAATWLTAHYL